MEGAAGGAGRVGAEDLKGSSHTPSLRMAARLAPLLPQIWHKGGAGPRKPATILPLPPGGSYQVPAPGEEGAEGEGLDDDKQLNLPKTCQGQKGRASLKPLPTPEGTGEDRSLEEHRDSVQVGVTSPLNT